MSSETTIDSISSVLLKNWQNIICKNGATLEQLQNQILRGEPALSLDELKSTLDDLCKKGVVFKLNERRGTYAYPMAMPEADDPRLNLESFLGDCRERASIKPRETQELQALEGSSVNRAICSFGQLWGNSGVYWKSGFHVESLEDDFPKDNREFVRVDFLQDKILVTGYGTDAGFLKKIVGELNKISAPEKSPSGAASAPSAERPIAPPAQAKA